jgi:acetyl esterase/lipase
MHAAKDAAFHGRVTYPVFGTDRAQWRTFSPMHAMRAVPPRFFVVVGERDYPYMIPQAEKARDRLVELGAQPRWLRVAGNDHDDMVLRFGASDDNMTASIVEFIASTAP